MRWKPRAVRPRTCKARGSAMLSTHPHPDPPPLSRGKAFSFTHLCPQIRVDIFAPPRIRPMIGRTESRVTGALLVAGAALLWSSGGVIFRSIRGAEDWTIAFWRSAFVVLALVAVLSAIGRRAGARGV